MDAAVQVLVQNLISMLSNEVKLVRGFEEDLEKLQDSLIRTQNFLSDAERKEIRDEAVKEWVKDLEDVAFEADAVLDEFNYHLLRKKVKNQEPATNEVSWRSSCSTSLSYRRKIASKINCLNKKLDTINQDAVRNGLKKVVMKSPDSSTIGSVETNSFSMETNVIGREEDVAKIVEMVISAPRDLKVSVIPIVGMGGLGKTTLAQRVFHNEKIISHFGKRIWVCVSFDFDEVILLRTILKTLTGEDIYGVVTTEVVLQNIHTILENKRYLIVLDDVWNEDFKKWDDFMKSLFGVSEVTQNVIIVTTREESVASLVKTVPLYKLLCLSEDDCWSIIKTKALLSTDNMLNYEEMGKCIAQKSGGLPLAANVIGGILRGKPKEEWSSILMNELSNFGQGENPIMRILKLSYNDIAIGQVVFCILFIIPSRF